MKKALVCGADGFIGHHLVARLKKEGHWVKGVDLRIDAYAKNKSDDFLIGDLRNPETCEQAFEKDFDEVYQLAADMGGAGFIFTGVNDADLMSSSALINLNVLEACRKKRAKRILYTSSACVYPAYNQQDPNNPKTAEDSTYPAAPDSEYGWEKLFSERLYLAYQRCHGLDVRLARLHNIFGPEGSWNDGREKSPAALCRKIAMASPQGSIEIWGDGLQTRSFLYIDECLEGLRRLMNSDWTGPVNLGSEEMITINDLAQTIMQIAGKQVTLRHIEGPLGVRGRNSDNHLIKKMLGWAPSHSLVEGLRETYAWIRKQVLQTTRAANYETGLEASF